MKKIIAMFAIIMMVFASLAMGPQEAFAATKDARLGRYGWRDKDLLVEIMDNFEEESTKHPEYELVNQKMSYAASSNYTKNWRVYNWTINVVDAGGNVVTVRYKLDITNQKHPRLLNEDGQAMISW